MTEHTDLPELPDGVSFDNLDPDEVTHATTTGTLTLDRVAPVRLWYYQNRDRMNWAGGPEHDQQAERFLSHYLRVGINPYEPEQLLWLLFQTQTTLVNLQVGAGRCGGGPEVIAHTWTHIADSLMQMMHSYEGLAYVVFAEQANPALLQRPEGGE